MSRFVVDDQLSIVTVLSRIRGLGATERLGSLRPAERILDDRVPQLLLMLRQPTFVTIDLDFWDRRLCHPGYCILYFGLTLREQGQVPDLLRALLRRSEFRSKTARMGKVVHVRPDTIEFWTIQAKNLQRISWAGASRRRRR